MFRKTKKKYKDAAKALGMSEGDFSNYLNQKQGRSFYESHLFQLAVFFKIDPSRLIDISKLKSKSKPQTSNPKP